MSSKWGVLNEPKLVQYDEKGNAMEETKLLPYCGVIELTDNGVIYVGHVGKNDMGDKEGDTVSVFDIEKNEVIDTITGFDDVSDIEVEGDYIFVSNYNTGDVTILDSESREIIGEVNLSEKGRLRGVKVLKN